MKSNMGSTDKIIRYLIALVIGFVGIYFKSWWGLLAIIPLLTALISFCPLYTLVGLNTCTTKKVH